MAHLSAGSVVKQEGHREWSYIELGSNPVSMAG